MNIRHFIPKIKRRNLLLLKAVCRNCGTHLHGRYCHACGQDIFSGTKRTVGSLVFYALDSIFSLDNKLFITLKTLIFQPGKLTKEYTDGRIIKYVHPSKLFWFISIVFFSLLTLEITEDNISKSAETNTGAAKNIVENTDQSGQPSISKLITDPEDKDNKASIKKKYKDNKKEEFRDKENFRNNLLKYAPYASFLLIPFFAAPNYVLFYLKYLLL